MPFDAANKVAIVGVGHSVVGRRLERPIGALAVDASLEAIADAGLTVQDIDGLATFPAGPGPGVGPVPGISAAGLQWMVDGLGIERLNWWANGGGNISTAIGYAIQALATNCCNYVLVWRAMYQPRGGGFGSGGRGPTTNLGPQPAPRVSRSEAYISPYGLTDAPTRFAPAYTRYMKMYGAKREHMAAYALAARKGANLNPDAIFYGQPITFDDYMNCRMISDPLCLLDCDMPVDGAAALVLTRADRSRDLKQPPAYVTAFGSAGYSWKTRPPEEWQYDTAANIGRTLWSSTHLRPSDMDGAMFYEGFSPDIYWWLEGTGFCPVGTAWEWIQDGRIELSGELPVNTFGGSISAGRLHGISHWVEAVKQVQNRADDKPGDKARQIPNVENILCATGMLGHGIGVVLSKDPR
jgi:acetyl-CoA acetyltransferase